MSSVHVYHCQRCVAPLEVPPGTRTIVCRYCATYNELPLPGAPRTAAPAAAPLNYGDVAIFEGTYQITFHGFPEGTKWKVAEKSGRIESDIYDIIGAGAGQEWSRSFFRRMKRARCSASRLAATATESKTAKCRRGISNLG